jgi:hypothetical protein
MFRKIPLALNNTTCKFIFVKLYITTGEIQENYSGCKSQVTGRRKPGRMEDSFAYKRETEVCNNLMHHNWWFR